MPQEEPDWPLITRPPLDRRTLARAVGLVAMALGVVILAVAAARRGPNLDLEGVGFSLGLVLFGGFLRM